MIKNSDKLTDKQRAKFIEINQANLLISQAWKMKENFMEIFNKQTTEETSAFFDSWYKNVVKSNIEPMKKVAKTLANFNRGRINIIKYEIPNAKVELFNRAIQKLNHIAQGYRNYFTIGNSIFFHTISGRTFFNN